MITKACLIALFTLMLLVSAASAQDEPLTPAQVVALVGEEMPERFEYFIDLNEGDKYSKGIEVYSGEIVLLIGERISNAELMLFVRDEVVGAVKLDQSYASVTGDGQQEYEAVLEELLGSSLKPDGSDPSLGSGTASWLFDEGKSDLLLSKAHSSQGLFFYARKGEMIESYMEYYAAWNAELDSYDDFYFF